MLAATPAAAHEGDHSHMVLAPALQHLFSQPNHLLIVGMAVAVCALPVARVALRRIRR
jgi:hypothetical protein